MTPAQRFPWTRPLGADARRADLWLALALLVSAILSAWLGQVAGVYGAEKPAFAWALVYSAAITLPTAYRRRAPELVLILVAAAFFVGVSYRIPEIYVGNVTLFIAMYSVGAWVSDRRRATIVRLVVIVGMFVWLVATTFQAAVSIDDESLSRAGLFSPFAAYMLLQFLVNAAFFGGAYLFGERAWAQARARDVLEERTRELERERELTAAQAVALDRVRIARELHDVVAHHVSAMGVQAGAARAVLERNPVAARQALQTVEQSARDALGELRHLLETLRTPDAETPTDATVHLSALPDLVAHATANGLPTTFTVIGDPVSVSELVQVNVHRIAQEALTNARRHGGPGATADVRLRYAPDAVELEVSNTGRSHLVGRPGLGLVGMRERAAASGGSLEAGPRPRGGFLVRLRVPLPSAAPTREGART
ncbi:sensor histidine kinase [Microbacterium dextranolyticum]|uniref:histidine kinase n=1 Tax=Microbacterium dextranolyticum TaxID=36806 RepID=A0A9W6HKI2_9MICO|nr:sensor histidine kinase [Microbacterium dextranolyticum]MBM7461848.1 signal transduction histidine kinase [Microbacterium dextranolyticum]GLJ94089.1 two-component sensor histidine kinase [Microbacterium dextranolyticum]